jgi:hypothetical protein
MAIASKLAPVRGKRPVTEMRSAGSPLTPELKEFIDRAIVPALVRQYLAELDAKPKCLPKREGK